MKFRCTVVELAGVKIHLDATTLRTGRAQSGHPAARGVTSQTAAAQLAPASPAYRCEGCRSWSAVSRRTVKKPVQRSNSMVKGMPVHHVSIRYINQGTPEVEVLETVDDA